MTKRQLKKLMEENNAKSPDILSVTAYPETNWEACQIAGIFLDKTDYKLPFSFEAWQRSIKAPVELYFAFEKRRQIMQFIKETRKEFPRIKLIF